MTTNIVEQAEEWFLENSRRLSQVFPILHFHLMLATDHIQGKATIQVEGPIVAASITFWNKGEVNAIVLDKMRKRELSLDDRELTVDDDVKILLQLYLNRIQSLANEVSS